MSKRNPVDDDLYAVQSQVHRAQALLYGLENEVLEGRLVANRPRRAA